MRELGVMLAYTPLHALLFDDLAQLGAAPVALVMTSGNLSDEPIAYRDDDALARLTAVADAFLVHDRPIRTRTDDSVARVVAVPA
jgi:hydrogenase maturation protein HypF